MKHVNKQTNTHTKNKRTHEQTRKQTTKHINTETYEQASKTNKTNIFKT